MRVVAEAFMIFGKKGFRDMTNRYSMVDRLVVICTYVVGFIRKSKRGNRATVHLFPSLVVYSVCWRIVIERGVY